MHMHACKTYCSFNTTDSFEPWCAGSSQFNTAKFNVADSFEPWHNAVIVVTSAVWCRFYISPTLWAVVCALAHNHWISDCALQSLNITDLFEVWYDAGALNKWAKYTAIRSVQIPLQLCYGGQTIVIQIDLIQIQSNWSNQTDWDRIKVIWITISTDLPKQSLG